MVKKGDTLIEVTIAIGIFSMVAIAIASVMNGGVSDAQAALETTLAREQIDSQAEALRFIHSSYINYKSFKNTDNPFVNLWKSVIQEAEANTNNTSITKFTPKSSCDELYNRAAEGNIFSQHAFIINTDAMGKLMNNLNNVGNSQSGFTTKDVVIRTSTGDSSNNNKFTSASTYPRLIYQGESDSLMDDSSSSSLSRAEGIYIVAVKDNKSTLIINENGAPDKATAFYDFYIRTCWHSSSSAPSTISTIVRLNDPTN